MEMTLHQMPQQYRGDQSALKIDWYIKSLSGEWTKTGSQA